MNYRHFTKRPAKLTAQFAKKHYQNLAGRVTDAEASTDAKLWLKLFADWNDLKSYIISEATRINHAFNKNMNNKQLEIQEKYVREKLWPVVINGEHRLTQAFLGSRYRSEMAEHYGQMLIPVFETSLKPLDPINTGLRVKDSTLVNKYDKLIATAKIKVGSETMTLWKARSLGGSPDEDVRRESYLARGGWILQNRQKMASIYGDIVKLRDQMGKNVGFDSYIPLAYASMCRTDYDPVMVAGFRDSIKKYMVPLQKQLFAQQAKALGVKTLRPWNAPTNSVTYNPDTSLPMGVAPIDKQLDTAQELFKELSPKLAKHFEKMRRLDLIDLENRPGKHSGAYCTSMSDSAQVAILLNSTGDADDISTLTHEMGHAFQMWESQHIESVDLQHPTTDLCEVHSMGMEFLSLPLMGRFFSPADAKKFSLHRWHSAVNVLCYVSIVDEFQHWVYSNPSASPDERDQKWIELSETYLPGIDYNGYEPYQATRWYAQGHLFSSPFYYIDYALAETGAMQLALLDSQDHQLALDKYLELCGIGGTKSILQALAAAELRSPFDETLIKDLAEHTKRILALK